jgi:hypothetical protein
LHRGSGGHCRAAPQSFYHGQPGGFSSSLIDSLATERHATE